MSIANWLGLHGRLGGQVEPTQREGNKMPDKITPKTRKTSTEQRVLNELEVKTENEDKVDRVADSRQERDRSTHETMSFKCECDNKDCIETIQMSVEEFEHVHKKANNFVVVPAHVQLDIERIVFAFSNYVIVEKLSLSY